MTFARIAGTVVADRRAETLGSSRCLLVEECDESGVGRAAYLVAVDLVGANRGELVLLAQGSSCRWHEACEDRPVDTVILAIVESVDSSGTVRYSAGNNQ